LKGGGGEGKGGSTYRKKEEETWVGKKLKGRGKKKEDEDSKIICIGKHPSNFIFNISSIIHRWSVPMHRAASRAGEPGAPAAGWAGRPDRRASRASRASGRAGRRVRRDGREKNRATGRSTPISLSFSFWGDRRVKMLDMIFPDLFLSLSLSLSFYHLIWNLLMYANEPEVCQMLR